MLTRLPLLLGTILAATAVAACGGDDDEKKILDTERIERAIEQSIKEKRNLNARVSCPSGTEQKKGKTFRCTATYKGGSNPFIVTQDDDNGAVHWEGVDQ